MVQAKGVWLEVDRQKREGRTAFFQRAAEILKKFNPLSDDFTQQTLYFLETRANLSAGVECLQLAVASQFFRAALDAMKPRIQQHPLDVARDQPRWRRWHSWCQCFYRRLLSVVLQIRYSNMSTCMPFWHLFSSKKNGQAVESRSLASPFHGQLLPVAGPFEGWKPRSLRTLRTLTVGCCGCPHCQSWETKTFLWHQLTPAASCQQKSWNGNDLSAGAISAAGWIQTGATHSRGAI